MSEQERDDDGPAIIGGVQWEAREALKGMRLARRSGDGEAEELSWLRYAEAVTNASYSGAAAAFLGILEQRETTLTTLLQQLAGERKKESDAILTFLKELQGGQTDLRQEFQKVGETLTEVEARLNDELGQVREWVNESRAHRQQLQEQIDALQAGMLPEAERAQLIQEHAEDHQRIGAIEQRLAELEEEVRQLRSAA